MRWVQDRTEHHLADTHARDLVAEASLALDAEGRFLAVKVEAVANFGAFVSTVNPTIPTGGMAKVLSGLYAIPAAAHRDALRVHATQSPVDAVRGAGKPETLVLLECAGGPGGARDGARPRRTAPAEPGPAGLPLPHRARLRYDSGDYPALLDAALREADDGWLSRRARRRRRAAGMRRGAGCPATCTAPAAGATRPRIVQVLPDGTIEARTGTQSQGQGHATAYAQMIAAALGVAPGQVRILQGDSDRIPRGGGTGGSSSTIVSATTLARAAEAAVESGREAAAELLEARRGGRRMAARRAMSSPAPTAVSACSRWRSGAGGSTAAPTSTDSVETWPAGVAIAEVEVDPDTGAVRPGPLLGSGRCGRGGEPACCWPASCMAASPPASARR